MIDYLIDKRTEFAKKIFLIGDGKVPSSDGKIGIDKELDEIVTVTEDLTSKEYPDVVHIDEKDYRWMCQRAILTARSKSIDTINDKILSKLPGDSVNCLYIDDVISPVVATRIFQFTKSVWASTTFT